MSSMLRRCAIFLALCYAVLPPGFCECRLEAMLLPADSDDIENAADHESEEEHCGCPQLKEECLRPPSSDILAAGDLPESVVPELPAPTPTPWLFSGDSLCAFRGTEVPLYLALRALLI
jgi:hypothetical protein